jgi:hypothetical protein
MVEHHIDRDAIAIVDDGQTMGPLSRRHVRVDSRVGFDDAAAATTRGLFGATAAPCPPLRPAAAAAIEPES